MLVDQIDGYIVEVDAEGHDDWRFVAFFVYSDDAVNYSLLNVDEPTRYRVIPQQPAKAMLAA